MMSKDTEKKREQVHIISMDEMVPQDHLLRIQIYLNRYLQKYLKSVLDVILLIHQLHILTELILRPMQIRKKP